MSEKGFALSQKYLYAVLMTRYKDFHSLSSISHRSSSVAKILLKPDMLQNTPVEVGTKRQRTLTAYPSHHDLWDYLSKSKSDKGYPQPRYNTYYWGASATDGWDPENWQYSSAFKSAQTLGQKFGKISPKLFSVACDLCHLRADFRRSCPDISQQDFSFLLGQDFESQKFLNK